MQLALELIILILYLSKPRVLLQSIALKGNPGSLTLIKLYNKIQCNTIVYTSGIQSYVSFQKFEHQYFCLVC